MNFYRTLPEDKQRDEARRIIENFVGTSANAPVNLPGLVTQKILEGSEQGKFNKHLFDEAQQQIFELMNSEAYRRYA